jgi:hypothetical protein
MPRSSLSYSRYFCSVDKSQDHVECDGIFIKINLCSENIQGQHNVHENEWKNGN